MEGFIVLHKSLLDWEWYDEPNVMRLFVHSMLKANYRDTVWRGKKVKRGQFISTPKKLGMELNLSIKQVRTALAKLESTGEMASEGTSQHTVFTVVNYDRDQPKGKQKDSQREQQAASEGQPNGKQEDIQEGKQRASDETLQDTENKEVKGSEEPKQGKPEESKGQAPKKPKQGKRATANKRNKELNLTSIPDDLTLSDHWRQLAENYWREHGVTYLSAETEFFQFVNNHRSKATMSANWQSNWQTWYCNAIKFSRTTGGQRAASQQSYPQNQSSSPNEGYGNSNGIGGTGEDEWFDEDDINELNDLFNDEGASGAVD